MSVLNRKMFRNNAARKALSEMGGIVSFANGGDTGSPDSEFSFSALHCLKKTDHLLLRF